MELLSKLKARVYPAASRYFSHATLLEGKLKNNGESFRCLFVENDGLMNYMVPRMYDGLPVTVRKWRLVIPFLQETLDRYAHDIDMAIVVLPRKYAGQLEKRAHFKSQTFICSSIDTSGGWDAVKKRFQHNKRQFCNRMDKKPIFSYRTSRELKDFEFFYYEMHIPHVQKRFQELAHVDTYEDMKAMFEKGFLIFIEEGEKSIAGILCEIQDNTLYSRRTGVLHGDEDYIRKGASSAEYYFMLKYALENGLSKVDLLRSRPFLNDGVYTTKRKWGAMVCPNQESDAWAFFFIPRCTEKIISFFEANPMISCKDDKMYGVIGWGNAEPPSEKEHAKFTDQYYSPGLEGLVLVRPDPQEPVRIDFG
jgi:hypothetical protein